MRVHNYKPSPIQRYQNHSVFQHVDGNIAFTTQLFVIRGKKWKIEEQKHRTFSSPHSVRSLSLTKLGMVIVVHTILEALKRFHIRHSFADGALKILVKLKPLILNPYLSTIPWVNLPKLQHNQTWSYPQTLKIL